MKIYCAFHRKKYMEQEMPSATSAGKSPHSGGTRTPGTIPVSERQQMALVLQMTSDGISSETRNENQMSSRARNRNERGETPLHIAAIRGDEEQVRLLLEQGADPNARDFAELSCMSLKRLLALQVTSSLNKTNGDEAKSIWAKLRNNHRDALRRQRRMRRSGVATADIKPWKFQAHMEFLLRYMVNENRDMNFADDDDHSEPPTERDQCAESETQHCDDDPTDQINDKLSALPNTDYVEKGDSLNLCANNEPVESLAPPMPQPKKKVKKTDIDNLIKKTIEQREQRSKERSEERKKLEERTAPKDDLYLFFMSVYEQTKKMPPVSQHIVRRNVFLTVSQEEAHLLNIAEPTFPPYQQFQTGAGKSENIRRTINWSNGSHMSSPASTSSSE